MNARWNRREVTASDGPSSQFITARSLWQADAGVYEQIRLGCVVGVLAFEKLKAVVRAARQGGVKSRLGRQDFRASHVGVVVRVLERRWRCPRSVCGDIRS